MFRLRFEPTIPAFELEKTVYTSDRAVSVIASGYLFLFLLCIVGGGINVHSTLRPLNGLLCQPRVIMMMEKLVE
jgi:hypothetical protein